jgi:hypothetical protein
MHTRSWVLGSLTCVAIFTTRAEQAWAVGSVSLSSPNNGGWVGATPTLRWTAATSATSYTLTITPAVGAALIETGLTTTSYTLAGAESLTGSAGPYAWHVAAYDASSASSDSGTWSFFVDTTPPDTFAITSPDANAWTNSSDAQVIWNAATDSGSGISAYHVYVDGVLCSNPAAGSTAARLYQASCTPGEGTHYWAVSVEDAIGNLTWCSECGNGQTGRTFRIDDTGPADPTITGGTFQIASSNEPDYYNSPGDRMVDTGITITAGQPLSISAAGNWCTLGCSSSIGCYSVTGSSSSGAVVPANCTPFSLIARIGGTFYCVGAGKDFAPTTSGKLYLGINSEYTGCSTPTVTATVTGGRSFDLIRPEDGEALSNRFPSFSWHEATDSGSGGVGYFLWVEQTDATNTNIESVTTTQTSTTVSNPLTDGKYEWYVRASDAAKNRTESVVRRFTIDTARPEQFRLKTPTDGSCTSVPTPSLCWDSAKDATPIASAKLYIDGALATTTTSTCATPPAALSQGQHSWYVVQTDSAGNWRQSDDIRQVWVDYTAPTAPALSGPANGVSLVDPPLFTWTAATDNVAIKSYELYVDGALTATLDAATLSYLPHGDLALGDHTWYVRALDRCGQATSAAAWSFAMAACTPDSAQHPCPGYNLAPCTPGTRTCTAAGTWSSCSNTVVPIDETCNGIDDNCDGMIDNSTSPANDNQCGGVCTVIPPYIWSPCDGTDADQCQEGHMACAGLNATVCVETTPNNVEICNGRDDDCNGVADDGCIQAGTGGVPGTGGMPGTGGTASTSGGTAGTSSAIVGGAGGTTGTGGGSIAGATSIVTGGMSGVVATATGTAGLSLTGGTASIAASGGRISSGGTYSTNNASSITTVGGVGTGAGGSATATLGGSSGATSLTVGGSSAATAGGQTSLTTSGGNTAATATGGTNGTTGTNVATSTSTGGQSSTSTHEMTGTARRLRGSDDGCGCRLASSTKKPGTSVLLYTLALLLLGRRRGRPTLRRKSSRDSVH